jgi:alkylation response protein AidB-like acyl-CoA dehydrogenase
MRFSRGCDAAEWILFVTRNGTCLVPKAQFKVVDDWHVSGLRGTGSKSILVEDAWIPPHRIVSLEDLKAGNTPGAKLYPDMPFYRVPQTLILHQLLLASVIGAVSGVLDLFEERIKRIDLHTGKAAAEGAGTQLRYAESAAELAAAKMFIRNNLSTLLHWAGKGHQPDERERSVMRRDITYASRIAVRAAERLATAGDASGMFDSNQIGRLWRDAHMGSLQACLTWDEPAQTFARLRWGLTASSFLN